MSRPRTQILAAAATAGLALSLAACGSSSSAAGGATAAPAASSKTTAAPTTPAAAGLPAAPGGAKELQQENSFGGEYARYEISGTSPQQVVSDYTATLQSAGYSVTSTGSGGGGWGKWGGAGAGLSATKSGSYASVQAGGSNSGPTYFEVCMGPNDAITKDCENSSDSSSSKS